MKQLRFRNSWRKLATGVMAFAFTAVTLLPVGVSAAIEAQNGQEQNMYKQAASEFQVPQELLMAVSYYQSRWENHDGKMSIDGGFGPMNLRTAVPVEDGRGDPRRPVAPDKMVVPKTDMTLDKAAQLLNMPAETLKKDVKQNIRGGAALLADKAKQLNNGAVPAGMEEWYAVAAKYLSGDNEQNVQLFIDQLHDILRNGKAATTSDGQQLALPAMPGTPVPDLSKLQAKLQALGFKGDYGKKFNNGAECPRTITCRFIPAAYGANSDDPADFGNYDHANRPHDMKVNSIIIHDTEGSYNSAISWFQTTQSYVSAHYVIRSSDGDVTQMVRTSDVAWHAGDWYVNMHSIGIEHEGVAAEGASWYTEAMYQSSANLVRYLAKKYDIPLDRDHILGHDNVPGLTDARVPRMHWDPGPYWDWDHYMDLIKGKKSGNAEAPGFHKGRPNAVTIKPTFSQNIQTVKNCTSSDPATCVDLTAPSNFVYLRTHPSADAPLITDPLLHPGGEPGTNKISDWTAKATAGQQYALAERQGDWTAIWFANQKAWFYNPASQPTASFDRAATIKLRPGLASTHVYGGAYPEASVYPADVPGPAQPQLSYLISAGQKYISDGLVPTDYFYDATIDYSRPHDHEIFKGQDRYLKIWYNQRIMFVKKADVVIE